MNRITKSKPPDRIDFLSPDVYITYFVFQKYPHIKNQRVTTGDMLEMRSGVYRLLPNILISQIDR